MQPVAIEILIDSAQGTLLFELMEESIHDIYEFLEVIGRGSYATVYRAIDRQIGAICAIKKISTSDLELTHCASEIGILSSIKSKNIVRYLKSHVTKSEVYIVMEHCEGGSVKDVMRQLGRTLTEEQIVLIVKNILCALHHAHSIGKVHRDVKAANVLLDEEGLAKLADFGVSESLDRSNRKHSLVGTLLWLPPEVINKEDYGSAIDIWSLGITVLEMAEGQPPYSELPGEAALGEISNLEKPAPTFKDHSKWSKNLINFLSLCLEKDFTRRKSAEELLTHELFRYCHSNDCLKNLVSEVCNNTSNNVGHEANLSNRLECLLKENAIQSSIYKRRKKKVIIVDQVTSSLLELEGNFIKLQDEMRRRDMQLDELRAQSETLKTEIQRQQCEKNKLSEKLNNGMKRRQDLQIELNRIKDQQRKYECLSQFSK